MDSVFPFGLPPATAQYVSLYVATFALHQFFMHYVLAGSLYIGFMELFRGQQEPDPLADLLREWLPFLLSAAITAGVAPLLFVQIVYPRHFYTANLLLGWKWMIVVPVLILAFYLLYLQKSAVFKRYPYAARSLVTAIIAGSFLFVGFCWTANHLLGNAEASWPSVYASGSLQLSTAQVVLRIAIWTSASFATLATVCGWQLWNRPIAQLIVRRLAGIAMGGLLLSTLTAGIYLALLEAPQRSGVFGIAGGPYLAAAAFGVFLQAFAWWSVWRTRLLEITQLVMATSGLLLSILCVAVVREVLRLQQVDLAALVERHADASQIDGFLLFLLFAVVNTALIGICIWIVRSGQRPGPGASAG